MRAASLVPVHEYIYICLPLSIYTYILLVKGKALSSKVFHLTSVDDLMGDDKLDTTPFFHIRTYIHTHTHTQPKPCASPSFSFRPSPRLSWQTRSVLVCMFVCVCVCVYVTVTGKNWATSDASVLFLILYIHTHTKQTLRGSAPMDRVTVVFPPGQEGADNGVMVRYTHTHIHTHIHTDTFIHMHTHTQTQTQKQAFAGVVNSPQRRIFEGANLYRAALVCVCVCVCVYV